MPTKQLLVCHKIYAYAWLCASTNNTYQSIQAKDRHGRKHADLFYDSMKTFHISHKQGDLIGDHDALIPKVPRTSEQKKSKTGAPR
jgi:hypothetical protein